MWHEFNDRLAIAGTLTASDLDDLVRRKFRTIIDLRGGGESAPDGLRPQNEEALATSRGIRYEQIPVGPHNLDVATAHAVGRAIDEAEPRILVHCASGRRAGFLTVMHLARAGRWTVERCMEVLEGAGIATREAPALRDLLIEYVSGHADAGAPVSGSAL